MSLDKRQFTYVDGDQIERWVVYVYDVQDTSADAKKVIEKIMMNHAEKAPPEQERRADYIDCTHKKHVVRIKVGEDGDVRLPHKDISKYAIYFRVHLRPSEDGATQVPVDSDTKESED